jgi:hypothetical protein
VADSLSADAEQSTEQPAEQEAPAPVKPTLRTSGLHIRFGAAYLALAALVGVAVGLFIVFLGDSGSSNGPRWSLFKPQDHGQAAAAEIARHVAVQYRLPSGDQIVGVLAGPPLIQDTRISTVAVRSGFSDERPQDIKLYKADHSLLFILCGFGKSCSIPTGKPSTQRAMLLRREGLELALYTFKYVSGVDSVLTIIPPPKGQQPKTALYFRKSDLESRLGVPLRTTLSPRDRLVPGGLTSVSQQIVHGLTGTKLYQYQFQSLPDGTAAVVLSPLTA